MCARLRDHVIESTRHVTSTNVVHQIFNWSSSFYNCRIILKSRTQCPPQISSPISTPISPFITPLPLCLHLTTSDHFLLEVSMLYNTNVKSHILFTYTVDIHQTVPCELRPLYSIQWILFDVYITSYITSFSNNLYIIYIIIIYIMNVFTSKRKTNFSLSLVSFFSLFKSISIFKYFSIIMYEVYLSLSHF